MPEDLHYGYIDPYFNNWREAVHVDNKCWYPKMFTGIAQPEMLAIRSNGMWFQGDNTPISRDELEQLLAPEPELVVKKAMGSEGGRGVFFVPGTGLSQVEGKIGKDIVIQRPVVQHPRLSAINHTSVNTIRVISLLTDGKVKAYSTILRMGINGARVDNASSGGITCGITEAGCLRKYAHTSNGDPLETHPNSGIVFDGYEIPGYHKCVEATTQLHLQMPHFRLISWDFSVDPAGEPILIEANLKYGQVDFHQLNNGPLFGENTPLILAEVFGKKA